MLVTFSNDISSSISQNAAPEDPRTHFHFHHNPLCGHPKKLGLTASFSHNLREKAGQGHPKHRSKVRNIRP